MFSKKFIFETLQLVKMHMWKGVINKTEKNKVQFTDWDELC